MQFFMCIGIRIRMLASLIDIGYQYLYNMGIMIILHIHNEESTTCHMIYYTTCDIVTVVGTGSMQTFKALVCTGCDMYTVMYDTCMFETLCNINGPWQEHALIVHISVVDTFCTIKEHISVVCIII